MGRGNEGDWEGGSSEEEWKQNWGRKTIGKGGGQRKWRGSKDGKRGEEKSKREEIGRK